MKYAYTCTIEDDEGFFWVKFPDLPGCQTEGETLEEALELAEDALNLMLWDMEEDNETIPPATPFNKIPIADGQVKAVIRADTIEYRKACSDKTIQKTVTLPEWLDTMARKKNINFSNFFQNALMKELDIAQ